ncbi:aminopeptidase N [Marinicella sp. S1101]|uniref:aminopeptidase N n=1 Tax=Marinicella marina TaxID=2996016 RepID=UPI0022609BF6|nr:aminopeptidase N [Marinicella marina]MCX7552678.1 aminopeptidase N [Marinicella marina]MDJ1139554.1 aminopeptidase N [Marinicella marina]
MSAQKQIIYRKDYQAPNYWVKAVDLAFMVEAEHTLVKARINFSQNIQFDNTELFLDGIDLELLEIQINGKLLESNQYKQSTAGLHLYDLPKEFELKTTVKIYPAKNTALEGLYQSGDFFLTQCEAEGFRKITYYLDRPDVLAPFMVTIVADQSQYPLLLSNGNPLSSGQLGGNRHYAKWFDPHPKPSYLFALVAGDLAVITDSYQTSEGREVTLNIYTEAQNVDACDFAMQSLINSMRWDEERFGLAYDLDVYNIVATDDFNMGAMENKGLNIFNSKYVLAKKDTATDTDFINVEAVIGHEYFHNWTGNRVTCKDWFQLSLKEGLTVFRDQEFTADRQSRSVKKIEDVRYLRAAQFAEDASPMSHSVRPDSYIEINNFYTLTVYEKGAQVVGMYHTLLGEAGFQKGMKLYFQRHDGQAVSCNDFRRAMADANQVDLEQFELWYSQNGTPQVDVQESYDAEKQQHSITLSQKAPKNFQDLEAWQAMHIPVRMSLFNSQGDAYVLDNDNNQQTVIELKEQSQTWVFECINEAPVSSLFQGFSAPVIVNHERSSDELAFLMKHDSDSFNRWDAAQKMQSSIIINKYQALLNDEPYDCPSYFLDSFRHVLLDNETDPALIAEAITLPALKSMMLALNEVDILLLNEAKEWLVAIISKALSIEFLSVYNQNYVSETYQVNARQVGKRSLKNRCLWYLLQNNKHDKNYQEMAQLAQQQYKTADNYTDAMAALSGLTHQQVSGFEDLLGEYYTQWQDNALVINKWLSIQATIPAEDTLERVKQLMDLPIFSLKNPNAVRSVIGAFCAGNITQFHAKNGSGYAFLADQVIALDAINPQVAARMVGIFNDFQQFNARIQAKMLLEMKRIHATENLSANVFEIIDRSIQMAKV